MQKYNIDKFCSSVFEYDLGQLSRLLVDAVSGYVLVELKVGEALEDLLERCLTHRVVLELVLVLQLFDQLEEETD